MKAEKSSGKESILSSLNALFIYANISGVPTHFQMKNHSFNSRISRYFWSLLSFACFLLNCYFQLFNFLQNIVLCFCDKYYIFTLEVIPSKLFSYSSYYFTFSFVTGIPLIFAFQFYFSGKFQKIWNFFQRTRRTNFSLKKFL